MLRGRVVLQFRSEAIKTENPATVQCDAFQIDIFSRQEARHCLCQVLVAVRVWFKFFSSLEDGWKKEDEEASVERGSKRLVEVRGSTNHSGRTAMDTSFHKGWLVSNVCSVAMLLFAKWCILKQFCFVRLFLTRL